MPVWYLNSYPWQKLNVSIEDSELTRQNVVSGHIAYFQTMTSLEIAELTGKQHKNVMQAIRNMEPAWEKVNGLKFQLVEYRDQKGELRPCYQLTKTECLYIATKFNDEARDRGLVPVPFIVNGKKVVIK